MSFIFICVLILLYKNKSPWIYPRALLPAIVHDYFFNRGVPGSADMIPSACEPVLFPTSIIHNSRKIYRNVLLEISSIFDIIIVTWRVLPNRSGLMKQSISVTTDATKRLCFCIAFCVYKGE